MKNLTLRYTLQQCAYWAAAAGVMLLAMFHAMTENYLIRVVEPLGGDSGT